MMSSMSIKCPRSTKETPVTEHSLSQGLKPVVPETRELQMSHLIFLPEHRQFIVLYCTFHHMDIVVINAKVQVTKPEHDTAE